MAVSALSVGPRYMQDDEFLAGSVCGRNCEPVLGLPPACNSFPVTLIPRMFCPTVVDYRGFVMAVSKYGQIVFFNLKSGAHTEQV